MPAEWKTVRVRAALLDRVKARAEAEGSNATAWIDRALGAALAEGQAKDSESPSASSSRSSAPRRAPDVKGELDSIEAEMIDLGIRGECPRAACQQRGRVGDPCPSDPHLRFKAVDGT